MSLYHRNLRAFESAQARFDNAAPEEDGPTECPECNGKRVSADGADCQNCDGLGWLTADGEPCRVGECQ